MTGHQCHLQMNGNKRSQKPLGHHAANTTTRQGEEDVRAQDGYPEGKVWTLLAKGIVQ